MIMILFFNFYSGSLNGLICLSFVAPGFNINWIPIRESLSLLISSRLLGCHYFFPFFFFFFSASHHPETDRGNCGGWSSCVRFVDTCSTSVAQVVSGMPSPVRLRSAESLLVRDGWREAETHRRLQKEPQVRPVSNCVDVWKKKAGRSR